MSIVIENIEVGETNQISYENKKFELGQEFVNGNLAKKSNYQLFMHTKKGVIGLKEI